MFWPVCVKARLTLCEWHSAGLHVALQPTWHLSENQWGRSCVGGLPEGIIWFSSNALRNQLAKRCGRQPRISRVGFSYPARARGRQRGLGKGFIVNMPGLYTGCLSNVCMIGLGDAVHPLVSQLLSHSRLLMWCIHQSQKAQTHTQRTYCEMNWNRAFQCFAFSMQSLQSKKTPKQNKWTWVICDVFPTGSWNGTQPADPEGSFGRCQVCWDYPLCFLWIHLKSAWTWFLSLHVLAPGYISECQSLRHWNWRRIKEGIFSRDDVSA